MLVELSQYDHFIVMFSGGKDSFACLGWLLDAGVPKRKIELWHQGVDGAEDEETFMDWECTHDYCRKVAQAFDIPIYFQWRDGGFKREMLKDNQKSGDYYFETPDGLEHVKSRSSPGTRLKFPATSPDLNVRWCSAYLKIDVAAIAIRNQSRFLNKKTMVLTGERAEESDARANYSKLEPHPKADNRDGKYVVRHVDHCRPVRDWEEKRVWDIMKKYKVNPHPAYHLGWGRVSCKFCIFGNKNQFASGAYVSPNQFMKIANYEIVMDHTIKNDKSVLKLNQEGQRYVATENKRMVNVATSKEYTEPIIIDNWEYPAGAFGELDGPT